MKINIQNKAKLSNKHLRFIKWRLNRSNRKYANELIYADLFIDKECSTPTTYSAVIKLGIKGHDLLISKKATSIEELWKKCSPLVERRIRKWKQKKAFNLSH